MIATLTIIGLGILLLLGIGHITRQAYRIGDSLDTPKDQPEPLELTPWDVYDPRPAEILNHGRLNSPGPERHHG